MTYDIIIIGGGASGMSAAITFGSAKSKFDWAADKNILVIDSGKSDVNSASFWNAPGIFFGKNGKELMQDMHNQLDQYKLIEKVQDFVEELDKDDDLFVVKTDKETYKGKTVILATGLQKFNIKTSLIDASVHDKIARKGKVKLENKNGIVSENLYVCGAAAGHQTMFAIASGDGVRAACEVLSDWGGNFFVPHDNAFK
ncbi:MAG: NAD(P)/FAD-dependent oxidoreductase [Ichthyobacteriaceae bacterium]|nr:NAD(P)/FAD-dependent oxidoreductase [Ichthyobacteriaceae bacterium]